MAGHRKAWETACGAKTRKGTACQRRPVPGKRRCPNHGGLSTGPKTFHGKERAINAMRGGWLRWRQRQAGTP